MSLICFRNLFYALGQVLLALKKQTSMTTTMRSCLEFLFVSFVYLVTLQICISSIYTDCQDVGSCISHAADSIGLTEIPSYKVIADDNDEWIRKTQESFVPVELTEDFWIVPEWTKPPGEQARNIILNPGLAFGTGDHPTTKLCLLLLHGLIKGGEIFLDYGTGSGILGIAAVKIECRRHDSIPVSWDGDNGVAIREKWVFSRQGCDLSDSAWTSGAGMLYCSFPVGVSME
ncbi:hypothetical protein IFM89_031768 [Coptis chinensis]|uniref:ETFB lysine methyltransferase n=1 Tax=Coptis chinensis TaxID=261450 RepID=A0A835H0K8_9MAGN|nr:hypothetical protein IFM89_031768 [Coptis chinensis]